MTVLAPYNIAMLLGWTFLLLGMANLMDNSIPRGLKWIGVAVISFVVAASIQ